MKREPREIAVVAEVALFLLAATLAVAPVAAQQVTGELGSPSSHSLRASTRSSVTTPMTVPASPRATPVC
jgi:hypothetical protein